MGLPIQKQIAEEVTQWMTFDMIWGSLIYVGLFKSKRRVVQHAYIYIYILGMDRKNLSLTQENWNG